MFDEERKCFRKGGRRKIEKLDFSKATKAGVLPNKGAKQFAMFAALRGFDKMLETARRAIEDKYADQ